MAAPISKCRGFTHPVLLLMRSSLKQPMRQTFFTESTTQLTRAVRSPLSRSFNSTTRQLLGQATARGNAAPRAAAAAPKAPPPRIGAVSPTSSYALRLAQNKHGATLFEAAPQRIFLASSYAAGLVCIGGAVVNLYYNVYNPPPGARRLDPVRLQCRRRHAGLPGHELCADARPRRPPDQGASLGGREARHCRRRPPRSGWWCCWKQRRLPQGPARGLGAAVDSDPRVPLKRIVVEPNEIIMKTRLFHPKKAEPTEIEKMRMGREWEKRKKEQQQYNRDHLMTAPFRDGAWAIGQFFNAIRRGLTGEGFAPIEIKGGKYKLDIVKGYALEDGRALDRIVRIESDPKYAHLEARGR
ncbi:hypothetical protein PG997_004323 [Apiospora hydei]|uniref:Mitochondrial import inner membrane translocase subunit Tim21 n=1 Tax=Apiospora hydei TaxID=1337664 RepID=A0ABR1X1R7_9PEZI